MLAVHHTGGLALRRLRQLWRQPAFVVIMLVQPIIWLLLFSQLFQRVTDIPGFTGHSYVAYLAPGVVIMNALMTAGWSGMSFIDDIDRGVMDDMLSTPVWRGALTAGLLVQQVVTVILQSVVIVALALAIGARFHGGIAGVLVMVAAAVLLSTAVAALSNGFALVVRQRESLIGAVTVVTLPLTFLSTVFMQRPLLPHWIRVVSRANPVDWAVVAAREAADGHTDWAHVAGRLGLLVALMLVCATLATRAFHAYQRSL